MARLSLTSSLHEQPFSILSFLLILLVIQCWIHPANSKFHIYEMNPVRLRTLFQFNPATNSTPSLQCINIGPTVANYIDTYPFLPESRYVAYRLWYTHRIIFYNTPIEATRYQPVFQVQRLAPYDLSFLVRVNTKFPYAFGFGFAQVGVCEKGDRILRISAGGKQYDSDIDSIKAVGCNRAHFVTVKDITPDENGFVEVKVQSQVGIAALAALCITRAGF